MRLRFRLRTLLFVTLILALIFAVVAPDAYEALRRASGCYVLGDVVRPGRMDTLGVKLTVQDAIQAAGGLRPNAHRADIRLVRTTSSGESVLAVDLSQPATNHILKPGDRLIVYRRLGD